MAEKDELLGGVEFKKLDLNEDVVYDVYDAKKMQVRIIDSYEGCIGMIGARSRYEALIRARKKYCRGLFNRVKEKNIIVILRAEIDYKPATRPLTVRELKKYQSTMFGVSKEIDEKICKMQKEL